MFYRVIPSCIELYRVVAFSMTFQVVPGLLMVMDDNDNPRVQAHAGAALVNFSEDCPKAILATYLDSIMAKLEAILSAKFKGPHFDSNYRKKKQRRQATNQNATK